MIALLKIAVAIALILGPVAWAVKYSERCEKTAPWRGRLALAAATTWTAGWLVIGFWLPHSEHPLLYVVQLVSRSLNPYDRP